MITDDIMLQRRGRRGFVFVYSFIHCEIAIGIGLSALSSVAKTIVLRLVIWK